MHEHLLDIINKFEEYSTDFMLKTAERQERHKEIKVKALYGEVDGKELKTQRTLGNGQLETEVLLEDHDFETARDDEQEEHKTHLSRGVSIMSQGRATRHGTGVMTTSFNELKVQQALKDLTSWINDVRSQQAKITMKQ